MNNIAEPPQHSTPFVEGGGIYSGGKRNVAIAVVFKYARATVNIMLNSVILIKRLSLSHTALVHEREDSIYITDAAWKLLGMS